MPREKFHTLTEQMFYILLVLREECYGMDIMMQIQLMTNERVIVGPGTLYNLLEQFEQAQMIKETKIEGRKRSYIITALGLEALQREYHRLNRMIYDYESHT
ncbi:PadR family transcriptional regulator [Fusibacter paucivorans]|uniref:PadR family transcriptional regulator n=1 Tax=Fusibacter paucivorans TaxID=76009 RepID=A0ABS5PV80_9FIRM|nr:PadR family transcriptional regulator [Fusibacter paucivorans]MBS7528541.1 PadR family transcriptional regulator [Fusibacter paucivorans]